jgi:hypothetical protein
MHHQFAMHILDRLGYRLYIYIYLIQCQHECFFFSPQFSDVDVGDHPQGDIAMFSHRPAMKVEIY